MWLCEECGFECVRPSWEEKEWEYTFIEVPYCPECGSHNIREIEELV